MQLLSLIREWLWSLRQLRGHLFETRRRRGIGVGKDPDIFLASCTTIDPHADDDFPYSQEMHSLIFSNLPWSFNPSSVSLHHRLVGWLVLVDVDVCRFALMHFILLFRILKKVILYHTHSNGPNDDCQVRRIYCIQLINCRFRIHCRMDKFFTIVVLLCGD